MATLTTVKSSAATLAHYNQVVCSKLTESLDHDAYTSLYNKLKRQISELESASASCGEGLTSSEQGEALATLNVAKGWQVKLLERVNFIALSRQITTKKRFVKLPEIKLITFKGDFDEWNTFWSSFRNNIDSRDDLEDSAKLSYLLQSVEGEPKEMIKGLPNTDANYAIALKILTDWYADVTKQTHVLLHKFYNLPSHKHNANDVCDDVCYNIYSQTSVFECLAPRTNLNLAEKFEKFLLQMPNKIQNLTSF